MKKIIFVLIAFTAFTFSQSVQPLAPMGLIFAALGKSGGGLSQTTADERYVQKDSTLPVSKLVQANDLLMYGADSIYASGYFVNATKDTIKRRSDSTALGSGDGWTYKYWAGTDSTQSGMGGGSLLGDVVFSLTANSVYQVEYYFWATTNNNAGKFFMYPHLSGTVTRIVGTSETWLNAGEGSDAVYQGQITANDDTVKTASTFNAGTYMPCTMKIWIETDANNRTLYFGWKSGLDPYTATIHRAFGRIKRLSY